MPISESENQTQEEAVEQAGVDSVGELLSAERHRLGLSEKEVADQLHITMHYVRAIESNNFEKLPGAVFAKGYIKSYAMLLGVAEERVMAYYNDFVSEQQDAAREKTRIQVRRRKDKNRPWVIASAAAFFGLFVVIWLFNDPAEELQEPGLTEVEENPETPINTAAIDATVNEPENEVILGLGRDLELADAPLEQAAGTAIESSELAEVQLVDLDSVPSDSPSVEVEPDVTIVEPVSEIDGSDVDVTPQEIVSESNAANTEDSRIIVEAVGDDVLVIVFSGESWLEISDGFDELIYRDLQEAGNELQVTGTAPFNILLGDAPFAQVSLNGAEIDFSENVRIDNSARLRVGL